MLSCLNDLARPLIKNNRISEVSGSPTSLRYTTPCMQIQYFSISVYTLTYRVISCHYAYYEEQVLNDIGDRAALLLNIHHNNADTPTECTIVGECTAEAGPFAVVSLESCKKANTCIFSRKIFLRSLDCTRDHSPRACVRTYVRMRTRWRTEVTIERLDRCAWGSCVIVRTSYLQEASSDDANAKAIAV